MQYHLEFKDSLSAIIHEGDNNVVITKNDNGNLEFNSDRAFKLIQEDSQIVIQSLQGDNTISVNKNGSLTCSGSISISNINGVMFINGKKRTWSDLIAEQDKKVIDNPDYSKKWTVSSKDILLYKIALKNSGDLKLNIGTLNYSRYFIRLSSEASGKLKIIDLLNVARCEVNSKGSGDISLVSITTLELCELLLSASGHVKIKKITTENLEVESSGSGDLKIKNAIIHSHGNLVGYASGYINMTGQVNILNVNMNGSGDANINLNAIIADLTTNASGHIKGFCVQQSLVAISNGSGDIKGYSSKTCEVTRRVNCSGHIKIKAQ